MRVVLRVRPGTFVGIAHATLFCAKSSDDKALPDKGARQSTVRRFGGGDSYAPPTSAFCSNVLFLTPSSQAVHITSGLAVLAFTDIQVYRRGCLWPSSTGLFFADRDLHAEREGWLP